MDSMMQLAHSAVSSYLPWGHSDSIAIRPPAVSQLSSRDSVQLGTIGQLQELVVSQKISDQLPCCTVKEATLQETEDGWLALSYYPDGFSVLPDGTMTFDSEYTTLFFPNEKEMNIWLANRNQVHVWKTDEGKYGLSYYSDEDEEKVVCFQSEQERRKWLYDNREMIGDDWEITDDGKYGLSYYSDEDKKEVIYFRSKQAREQWLDENRREIDVWKIEDCRDEKKPKTVYKLQRLDEWGYEDFATETEFNGQIKEDFYGKPGCCLWKFEDYDTRELSYIRYEKVLFERDYKEIQFEDLAYVAGMIRGGPDCPHGPRNVSSRHVSLKQRIGAIVLCGLALCGGARPYKHNQPVLDEWLYDGHYRSQFSPPRTSSTPEGAASSMPEGTFVSTAIKTLDVVTDMGAGFGGAFMLTGNIPVAFGAAIFPLLSRSPLLSGSHAQNLPPVVANPIADIEVYPGEPVHLPNVQKAFSDPDEDTLDVTVLQAPTFLNVSHSPFALVTTINGTGSSKGIKVANDLMYVLSWQNQIWNISDLFNPERLSTFKRANSYAEGVIDGEFFHLAATTVGFEIWRIGNPRFPSFVSSPPHQWETNHVALDSNRKIAWVQDGNLLNATDVIDPWTPRVLGTMVGPSYIIHDIFIDEGGFIYILGGYDGGLSVVNGTDPYFPNAIGYVGTGDVPQGVFVRDGIAYVTVRYNGARHYNVSDHTTDPTLISWVDEGNFAAGRVVVSGPYEYVSFTDEGYILLIDIRYIANPQVYTRIPTAGSPEGLQVIGNRLYAAGDMNVPIYDINQLNITGPPEPQDRGVHPVTIRADDGRGGIVLHNFNIIVINGDPFVLNAISDGDAQVGERYERTIDVTNDFSDPEGDLLVLSSPGLPWLPFDPNTNTFSGVPTTNDIGTFSVNVTAEDPFGGNVTSPFVINVVDASGALLTFIIIAIAGALLLLVVTSVGLIVCLRRRNRPDESPAFELSPTSRDNVVGVFGEGKYAWLDFNEQEERERLFKETGMILPDNTGVIGRGQYGAVKVCWSLVENQYMVAKIVDGRGNFDESKEEAQLQRDAAGPGVWSIANTITDEENDRLIHLMPLAGYNNLKNVRARMRQAGKEEEVERFAAYIGYDVLTGLKTIRSKSPPIYHCDLKGDNVVTDESGHSGITDFGRGVRSNSPVIEKRKSDFRYRSPQRLAGDNFRADEDDAWAAGCLLLEFVKGESIEQLLNLRTEGGAFASPAILTKEHFNSALCGIRELEDPKEGSLWFVIKGLLSTNEKRRLTPARALKMRCFEHLDGNERGMLFNSLAIANDTSEQAKPGTPLYIGFEQKEDEDGIGYNNEQLMEGSFYYDHEDQEQFYCNEGN